MQRNVPAAVRERKFRFPGRNQGFPTGDGFVLRRETNRVNAACAACRFYRRQSFSVCAITGSRSSSSQSSGKGEQAPVNGQLHVGIRVLCSQAEHGLQQPQLGAAGQRALHCAAG